MAVLVSDSFNRTSTTTLGSTDSYNGGTSYAWTPLNSSTWGTNGSQGYSVTDSGNDSIVVDPSVSDVTVSVDIVLNGNEGIVFRATDDSNYLLVNVTTTTINLFRRQTGTYTNLASKAQSQTNGTTYTLQVQANSSSITVSLNGTTVITSTSTFNQTATKHGLREGNNPAGKFDNFQITGTSTGGTNASITSVAATSTNSAVAPTVSTQQQISISSVAANSSATGIVPSVSTTGNVSVASVVASVNAQAVSPTVIAQQQVSIAGTVANNTLNMMVPSITAESLGSVGIASVVANATANANAPSFIIDTSITAIIAESISQFLSPIFSNDSVGIWSRVSYPTTTWTNENNTSTAWNEIIETKGTFN